MGARQPRMLVVDDDPLNRKLLEGFLRGEGYVVESAEDGPAAIETALARPPDVVLLDVMMPGMSGYDVCRRLKASSETRLSQVMLVTALDGTPDRVAGLDHGADDHVAKPVRREEFLAKVRALLRARTLLAELEHARGELAQRNEELQLKKTLAETLVHDLKNPLTAILGNLELLSRCSEELEPGIDASRDCARRMLRMVLDLLDVEGLEAGRLEPALEQTDAASVVSSSLSEARVVAEQKRIRLELDAPSPVWLEADSMLLRRVVDNLVSNAVSHSPAGTVIQVGVLSQGADVEIVVADEGPGVPEEQRQRVFDKYTRIPTPGVGSTTNRGLGLTFCRLAVEAHGGSIWVESADSGGARFCALLPSQPQPSDLAAEPLPVHV